MIQWLLQREAKAQAGANTNKSSLSPDWGLQFDPMKLKSLVIADQNAAVNTFSSLVLTARQVKEVEGTRRPISYGPKVNSITRAKA